MFLVCQG